MAMIEVLPSGKYMYTSNYIRPAFATKKLEYDGVYGLEDQDFKDWIQKEMGEDWSRFNGATVGVWSSVLDIMGVPADDCRWLLQKLFWNRIAVKKNRSVAIVNN
jgi:hypothetical protein